MVNQSGTVYMGEEKQNQDEEQRYDSPSTGNLEQKDPKEAITHMAEVPNKVIMEISGMFPFDFFPDKITVDMQKVLITYRTGPFTSYTFPIPHQKLLTVKVANTLFFSAMQFEVEGYETNPDPVEYLPKGKAKDLRNLIIGINAALGEKIDILEAQMPPDELRQRLIQIGASNQQYAY